MTNEEKYPSLKTDKTIAEHWWNSLSESQRIEVGSVAIHMRYMSPNFRWACRSRDIYEAIKPSQKRIINNIFRIRNKEFQMFPNIYR